MTDAFFVREDARRYVPTELTRGPWDPDAQHAGPPAALLGTALERHQARPDAQVVRVTCEILRPVPLAPLTVATERLRPGRSVELLAATLSADDEPVMRATAWRVRTADLALDVPAEPPPPGPGSAQEKPFFPTGETVGYHTAMEVRFVRGGFTEQGRATAWMRMRHPLIAGEAPSPLARVLIAADSGNGVSGVLDYRRWLFINTDLTVYLHREPVGEWVCLDATTTVEPHGVGLATSVIADEHAVIGRGLQALFVAAR
jgi:hypothetical protein